jgi:hypothetical protein
MSVTHQAQQEMARAGFSPEDIAAMRRILELFFASWDSGGAVSVMAPVLQRCIAGKCLTPLTGADDEWMDVSAYSAADGTGPIWQNVRCSTVFKDYDRCYDIDTPGRPTITFPYWPERADIPFPTIEIHTPARVSKLGAWFARWRRR